MANMRANISGEERDVDNRKTALETAKSSVHFMNFGSLTAKNRTFYHIICSAAAITLACR